MIYTRPAVEPLYLAFWKDMSDLALSDDRTQLLASLLTGCRLQWPSVAMTTNDTNPAGRPLFPAPSYARGWLKRTRKADHPQADPVKWALYCFAEIILSHPLIDGNGRFARGFAQAAISRRCEFPAPALPLGPIFALHKQLLELILRKLADTGDWTEFFKEFMPVIEACIEVSEYLLCETAAGCRLEIDQ